MADSLMFKYLKASLKAMSEFRLNFIVGSLIMIFTNLIFMGSIIYLGYRFSGIGNLTTANIIFALTVMNLAYAFGMNFFSGISRMQDLIIRGELDRFLTKPISIYKHILIHRTNPYALGEIITSLILLSLNPLSMFPLIFLFSITGAILINLNVYVINLLPMFIDINRPIGLFDAYIQFATNPPEVYNSLLKFISLFIIPGAMVGFGAVYAIKSNSWAIIYFAYLIFSVVLFFILSKLAVKKYRSAGY